MLATESESLQGKSARVVESISFRYTASQELTSLLEDFRLMCNDAIRVAIEEKAKSRFELIQFAYSRLKEYGLHTHYILSACEVAYSAYRDKNRRSVPYVRRAFLKLDNQSYSLNHFLLRIPTTPRHYIFLILHGSDYHLSFIDDPGLRRGSVTVTDRRAVVAFSKEVTQIEPLGFIGVDINERNVTVSATNGYEHMFAEFGEVAEIKERYREIRARIGRRMRNDRRITRGLLDRYGRRERNRTMKRIHKVTKGVVEFAKENNLGIKMEKLTGIRKRYKRGNGLGRSLRARMNSWVFGETQRKISYKAAWLGVPVFHVNPRGTSQNCPECGSRVVPLQDRKLYCQKCDKTWDRDDLASKNIMARAVPQARPPRGSDERERGDDGSNPSSRWGEVNLGVGKQLPR